jgi:hypothetical protein
VEGESDRIFVKDPYVPSRVSVDFQVVLKGWRAHAGQQAFASLDDSDCLFFFDYSPYPLMADAMSASDVHVLLLLP